MYFVTMEYAGGAYAILKKNLLGIDLDVSRPQLYVGRTLAHSLEAVSA